MEQLLLQDSVEAEVMEAAQAPIGQGPLRPAEGKEPKALQAETSRLMSSCEKLRARKRFFANKVEEINNPPPPPPRPSSPAPANPLPVPSGQSTGADAAQPSSADTPSPPTSLDCLAQAVVQMHARTDSASLPSSNQMHMVESWVVTPPATRASSPTATPQWNPPGGEPSGQAADAPVSTMEAEMTEMADDTPAGGAEIQQAHAGDDANQQDCKLRAEGTAKPDSLHLSRQGHDTQEGATEACVGRHSSTHGEGRQAHAQAEAEALPLPAQHSGKQGSSHSLHSSKAQSQPVSRPSSSHSMQSAQQAKRAQQLSGRPLSLLWGDGVRAPAGIALAIGPWAHTSGTMPVTTQAVSADVITLEPAGPAESQSDCWKPQQSEPCTHAQAADSVCSGEEASLMEVDDQAKAAQEAAERAEVDQAATTRGTTPDSDGGSSASQMCNVCLCPIRQLIIVLQPCGHYYCENCTAAIRAVVYPRCPECRTRISSTFRVPLSSSQNQTHKEDAQHAQVSHPVGLRLHLYFSEICLEWLQHCECVGSLTCT